MNVDALQQRSPAFLAPGVVLGNIVFHGLAGGRVGGKRVGSQWCKHIIFIVCLMIITSVPPQVISH